MPKFGGVAPEALPLAESPDIEFIAKAEAQYAKVNLPGSPGKDFAGKQVGVIAGGEFLGSEGFLGAERSRRFVLSLISAFSARMPAIVPYFAAALTGSWIHTMLFRRPLLVILNKIFDVGGTERSQLRPLPRDAASELLLSAALAPLATSDLRAPILPHVYTTDASEESGGVVRTEEVLPTQVSQAIYCHRERKGGYAKLDNRWRAHLQRIRLFDDDVLSSLCSPNASLRLPAMRWDFLELGGPTGILSEKMGLAGAVVGPVLYISKSPHFDTSNLRFLEWIFWLIDELRVESMTINANLFGFWRREGDAYSRHLSLLLTIMACLRRRGRKGVLAMPFPSGAAKHHTSLLELLRSRFDVWTTTACAFGAPQHGQILLCTVGFDFSDWTALCSGHHAHLKLDGEYAALPGAYWPEMADAWALSMHRQISEAKHDRIEAEGPAHQGLNSIVVNSIADGCRWKTLRKWKWRGDAHINVLEMKANTVLFKQLVHSGLSGRFLHLVDSRVTICVEAKGRSASIAMGNAWESAVPYILGGALYPGAFFVPSARNRADGPSRSVRPMDPTAELPDWFSDNPDSFRQLRQWLRVPHLRRAASNWAKFVLLLAVPLPSSVGAY